MVLCINVFKIDELTFLLRTVIICFAILLHLLITFALTKTNLHEQ
ncbi:hypothetical protein RC62_4324 [Flavobacterium aquidurense]|uniref:Uncharacterized protein n=1 Tax=Flavobacterium aquidurense TaxID=362413 RepID=A0A0Q0SAK3_9FLAO|nr:hypothetical protein RC62_4324 [Flavobacterium aquidurense]